MTGKEIRKRDLELTSTENNKKQKITAPTQKSSTATIMLTLPKGNKIYSSPEKYRQAFKLLRQEGKVGRDDGAVWPKITTESIVDALNRVVYLDWVEEALDRFKNDPYWSYPWTPQQKRRMYSDIIEALQKDIEDPQPGDILALKDPDLRSFYSYSATLYVSTLSYDIQASTFPNMDALKKPENYPLLCQHFQKELSALPASKEVSEPEPEYTVLTFARN